MAVPLASLQRAATHPLAAGRPAAPSKKGAASGGVTPSPLFNPAPAPPQPFDPDPSGTARRKAENDAATAAAQTRTATALQPPPFGLPASPPPRPAAPSQPAAAPFNPFAEQDAAREAENVRMAEFQRQRAIQLQRDEAEQTAAADRERRSMEAFQMARAEQVQREEAARVQAPSAPQPSAPPPPPTFADRSSEGAFGRTEGNLDASADRTNLFQLVEEARQRGLVGPASSSSSASAMNSLGNAAGIASPVARVPQSDGGAASRAAFSTAKDRVGSLGRGAMNSLSREMSGRGLSGSSIEGHEMGNLVGKSQGELAGVVRDQAGFDARRAADVEDRNFAGDLTQRGQDMAALQEQARFGLAQRSQRQSETNAGFSNLQGLMSLIRRGRRVY